MAIVWLVLLQLVSTCEGSGLIQNIVRYSGSVVEPPTLNCLAGESFIVRGVTECARQCQQEGGATQPGFFYTTSQQCRCTDTTNTGGTAPTLTHYHTYVSHFTSKHNEPGKHHGDVMKLHIACLPVLNVEPAT